MLDQKKKNRTSPRLLLLAAIVLALGLLTGISFYSSVLSFFTCSLPETTNKNFTWAVGPYTPHDSVQFSLIEDKKGNLCLYSYADNSQHRIWDKIVTIDPKSIKSGWYDQSREELLLAIVEEGQAEIKILTPSKYWLSKKNQLDVASGYSLHRVQFLHYYPDTQKLLMLAISTNDCTMRGEVFILDKESNKTFIQEVGSGCEEGSAPKYIDFANGILYFATYGEKIDDPYFSRNHGTDVYAIKQVFSIDPLNLNKEIVIDAPDIPEYVYDAYIARAFGDTLGLYATKYGWYAYDMKQKVFYDVKERDSNR